MRMCLGPMSFAFYALLVVVAIPNDLRAGVNARCLNSDAAAQGRMVASDQQSSPAPTTPSAPPDVKASEVSVILPNRDAQTAYPLYPPYGLPPEVRLDWNKWPSTRVVYAGRTFSFMGIHLTNKDGSPCIRLMFRLLAPTYEIFAGIPYLVSGYESGNRRVISVAEAVSKLTSWDSSEKFYVIDLTRLQQDKYWKARFDLYLKNVRSAGDPRAHPVHLERLLFNVIRRSRYPMPLLKEDDRQRFKEATLGGLKKRGHDCAAEPESAVCILNSTFMNTELGNANPLSVTDALDNSGLAFGPRQLDLGQGRRDATQFAIQYLIDKTDPDEADWGKRFLQPIEAMGVRDLSQLYVSVTRKFNDRLAISSERVMDVYVDGLLEMVSTDYKLTSIRFIRKAELLARLVAADFSNKWGDTTRARLVAFLRSKNQEYDECAVLTAWAEGVEKYLRPADTEDFRRRARIIKKFFSRASNTDLSGCVL